MKLHVMNKACKLEHNPGHVAKLKNNGWQFDYWQHCGSDRTMLEQAQQQQHLSDTYETRWTEVQQTHKEFFSTKRQR